MFETFIGRVWKKQVGSTLVILSHGTASQDNISMFLLAIHARENRVDKNLHRT
jgi:hypothetical protein